MTGKDFRRRVDQQFRRFNPAEPDERGSLSWFGRIVDKPPKRVWSWCEAKSVPNGPAVRMLQVVERMPVGTKWVNEPKLLEKKR